MMMDLDDDDGPLKMTEEDRNLLSPGSSAEDYSLPRPPSPSGLQRTFTPLGEGNSPPRYHHQFSSVTKATPSHHHHPTTTTSNNHHQHFQTLLQSPFPKHPPQIYQGESSSSTSTASPYPSARHSSSSNTSCAPPLPPSAMRPNGKELKRAYAYNYYADESPSDVAAFPPPTPFKSTFHHEGSARKSSHHHHHHHHAVGLTSTGGDVAAAMPPGAGASPHLHAITRFENDFDVISVIGSGCFGEVYRVRCRLDGVEYAIKCTRRRFKGQADRQRYLQEVKALAKVCNSDSSEEVLHIMRYHQAWIEDERLYMQTELCETSLDKRLLLGFHMNYDEVFDFLRQMLLALDVIHRNGLVHLDIKPANIFIKNGHYKLGDFGLVTSVTTAGMGDCLNEGDSRYMSAELLHDGPKDLTKCDIFSLGVTVYEICRGQPLPSNGPEWHAIRSGQPPPIEVGQEIDPSNELMVVLRQMMASEASQRPSAAVLLTHPRLRSKVERELLRERQRTEHLKQALYQKEKNKSRKLARTSTY